MQVTDYKTDIEYKVLAYKPITYDMCLVIVGINYGIDDTVLWGCSYKGDMSLKESVINYDGDNAYFEYKNERYYLNDFMRI